MIMSEFVIQPVGQQIPAQPIEYVEDTVYGGLQAFWGRIRGECEEVFTPSQCQSLLGVRPTILEPQQYQEGIAWYWLVLIGVGIGKVVL